MNLFHFQSKLGDEWCYEEADSRLISADSRLFFMTPFTTLFMFLSKQRFRGSANRRDRDVFVQAKGKGMGFWSDIEGGSGKLAQRN